MSAKIILLFAALALSLGACKTIPDQVERRHTAETLATTAGMRPQRVDAGGFPMLAYLSGRVPADETLTLYLEGDGLAWISSSMPSLDPTPLNPLALKLAVAQPGGAAAYLARPCQYGLTPRCEKKYWTSARFAEEIVAAMNDATDIVKRATGARRLRLVGYSGGGAMAVLLAARRSDVDGVVTVAGNLDTARWTEMMKLSPLHGSLNPADSKRLIAYLPQWHFAGGQDRVIPPEISTGFAAGMPRARRILMPEYGHQCCWAENWADLWREQLAPVIAAP